MARVFVSHANDDPEPTDEVYRWLVAEGHEVFLDRDLRDGMVVGEEWEQKLLERLRWADAVVCVVTSAFLASAWCPYEVGYARALDSRLLPVLAEPGVDHSLVKSAQYADLTKDHTKARAALVEALRRIDAAGGWGWPDGRPPFPGLRAFGVEDHRVFFGRGQEVNQLAALLRSPAERAEGAVLLVVGPSGCGKSSLVRAGLLPVMTAEPGWWTLPAMLPGTDPVTGLARELAVAAQRLELGWTVAQVRHQLDETGLTGLVDDLLLAARARRLLVVVDQFEELLTQSGPGERARFAQLLRSALGGRVQVVATLRPEFLDQLDQLKDDSDPKELPTRTFTLRPLSREALRVVIEGPARLAGIKIDDELVARLVTDTDSGEALPLLAFTLDRLAEGVGRDSQLSTVLYEQFGGVQGALVHQADVALADASAASGRRAEEVMAGLLRLVTVDEQGRPTRWRVPRDDLSEPVTRELDAFVTRRLVSTDTHNGSVVVEVAHEAFLTAWTPLAQAIEKSKPALQARRAVEQAAAEWHDHGRSPTRLWERGQLAAAISDTGAHLQTGDLVTDHVELSSTARAFLHASIRCDHVRRRRTTAAVLSIPLVFILAVAVVTFVQQRTAKQRDVAISQQVAGQAMRLRDTSPALAAQLSLAAYRLAPTTEARNSLLNTFATPYATPLTGHADGIHSVAFSPDGHTLATGSDDGTVRLWNANDLYHPNLLGFLTADIKKFISFISSVAFSPDGHTLATGSLNNLVRLWDVHDPGQPRLLGSLPDHVNGVYSVAFSPDGSTLATGSGDATVRLWNVRDPQHPYLLHALTGHMGAVSSLAFSGDGHTLATGSYDMTVRLWDVSDPRQPHPLNTLTGHTKAVFSVAFSPDSRTLATGSDDNTARLWDVSDSPHSRPLSTLTGHAGTVFSVAFSGDGHTLATGSDDKTARLWNVHDPYQPRLLGSPLTGHAEGVFSVAFSPDSHTLATGSDDKTARLWDLPGPTMTVYTNPVSSVAFSPDGRTLATGSYDKTVRLWNVSDPGQPSLLRTLTDHSTSVTSVAFSPDGHILATGSYDKTVRLWNVRDPDQPTLLGTLTGHTKAVYSVAFSPDSRTLATSSDDNTTRLWDVSDSHHFHPLSTLTGHAGTVFSVAFSGDGHTLATGSYDKTVRLWNVRDPDQPTLLGTLTGHTKAVYSVAFSPDRHTLATASDDATVRLWETNVNYIAARICNITPALTKSQWDHYLSDVKYQPLCPWGTT